MVHTKMASKPVTTRVQTVKVQCPILSEGLRNVESSPGDITRLLAELRAGNRGAEAKLISLVYVELKRLAAHYLKREPVDHTLQPTALVHEAYLRLTKLQRVDWQSRSHFLATNISLIH
jgi:ECF sigma factor